MLSEQHEKKTERTNRASEAVGLYRKNLTFVLPKSQKENRKGWGKKVLEETMSKKLPKLVRDTNLPIQRSANPKQR